MYADSDLGSTEQSEMNASRSKVTGLSRESEVREGPPGQSSDGTEGVGYGKE